MPTKPPLASILDHAATLPMHLGLQVTINVLLALSCCSFENILCEQAAPRDRTGKAVFRACVIIKGADSRDGSEGKALYKEWARVMIPNLHIKTWHSSAPL